MTVLCFPSAALGLESGTPLERPGARGTPASLIDLPTRAADRRGTQRRAALRSRSLRLGVPMALVVLWQLASSLQLVAPETLLPPTVILAALKELIADGELQIAIGVSLVRAATGLAIGGGIASMRGCWPDSSASAKKSSTCHCRCFAPFRSSR